MAMRETQNISPLIIKRTAIDEFGWVGSLYDACRDRVLEELKIIFEESPTHFHQTEQCVIKKGVKDQKQNLLEMIEFDEQLRLSVLLCLIPRNGITALIDYPHKINEYTRVFHYSYVYREERISKETTKLEEWFETTTPEANATHIITSVSWGVDIVVILQLPSEDDIATALDDTLEKYRTYLNGDHSTFKLTCDDMKLREKIISIKIYSNIPAVTNITTLHEMFYAILRLRTNYSEHQRLSYNLCPIQWFYSQDSASTDCFVPLDSTCFTDFEQYLFELSISMKILDTCFNENMPNLLCGHFKGRFSDLLKQWIDVRNKYLRLTDQFAALLIEIRSGRNQISKLDRKLKDDKQMFIKNSICQLAQDVTELNAKGHLISDLGPQHFQYCNVAERGVIEDDNEHTLQRKLIIDNQSDRVLCSNDTLNKNNPTQWNKLRWHLVEALKKNSKLRLIYADFSYCTFELHDMMILPSSVDKKKKKKTKQKETSLFTEVQTSAPPSTETKTCITPSTRARTRTPLSPSVATTGTINILLLGETGVGKSTFINAFANYLTFNTLENAQSNEPVVLIPVSFLITVGDDFEEHIVKFGDVNNSNNEDFNHPGQSVTQHCKNYKFQLNHNDGKKLRIIDTPGFGDTRGVDQDDRNMKHILEYIKKLPHLNAVCFLFKPNESRLNIFFRSCLTQLLSLLGPNASHNIIFCFTNARSTFYTPGNTAPLLKDMLASLPIGDTPFNKENTFCFDSESFRYLVAKKNNVSFSDLEKHEYAISWSTSVNEANRFIHYIRNTLTEYDISNQDHLIKRAQVDIVKMIRPMLDALRDILRNIINSQMNSLKESTKRHAKDIPSHQIQNNYYNEQHLPDQPLPIDFLQNYKIVNDPLRQQQNNMIDQLSLIFHVSVEFAHFLIHVARYRQGDPFLPGLLRMIDEENNTGEGQNQSSQVAEGLKKLANEYEQRMNATKSNPKYSTLSDVNEWIKCIHGHLLIPEQSKTVERM